MPLLLQRLSGRIGVAVLPVADVVVVISFIRKADSFKRHRAKEIYRAGVRARYEDRFNDDKGGGAKAAKEVLIIFAAVHIGC